MSLSNCGFTTTLPRNLVSLLHFRYKARVFILGEEYWILPAEFSTMIISWMNKHKFRKPEDKWHHFLQDERAKRKAEMLVMFATILLRVCLF